MTRIMRVPGETFAGHVTLHVLVCGECGVMFAMPHAMYEARKRDRETFWCPNGHCRAFIGETDAEKLERERQRSARLRAELDQKDASLRAQRAATTRARKERDRERTRVSKGICPCCHRTFVNVAQHMKTKHPDYGPAGPDA